MKLKKNKFGYLDNVNIKNDAWNRVSLMFNNNIYFKDRNPSPKKIVDIHTLDDDILYRLENLPYWWKEFDLELVP